MLLSIDSTSKIVGKNKSLEVLDGANTPQHPLMSQEIHCKAANHYNRSGKNFQLNQAKNLRCGSQDGLANSKVEEGSPRDARLDVGEGKHVRMGLSLAQVFSHS